jgi:hypothetical protein
LRDEVGVRLGGLYEHEGDGVGHGVTSNRIFTV